MENELDEHVDRITAGFGIAAAVTILFSTMLTIAKELTPALLAWMKKVTWHHWTTHGFIVLGVFLLLGWFLSQKDIQLRGTMLAELLTGSVFIGGLGIVVFFLFI